MEMAAPMPPAEPVTSAILLSRRKVSRMFGIGDNFTLASVRGANARVDMCRLERERCASCMSATMVGGVPATALLCAGTRRRPMKLVQMADAVRYARMTSAELRETFLLEGMFNPGKIEYAYVDLDRTVIGSAVPTGAALILETQPELRAEYFLERRELGVLNVGGAGTVAVDGKTFELDKLDCLYVGRGSKSVSFASKTAGAPACFYLRSEGRR